MTGKNNVKFRRFEIMKSVFKIVLLVLGLLQISIPVINVITSNNDNILIDTKVIFFSFLNSIIYFAVVYLLNENDRKDKKLEEVEKRLEYQYKLIKNIENISKE
jgi:hypothetical protein